MIDINKQELEKEHTVVVNQYNASRKQTYIDDLNARYDQQYAPVADEPLLPMGKDLPVELKQITPEHIYDKIVSELSTVCSINKLYYKDSEVIGVSFIKRLDPVNNRPDGSSYATISALLGNIVATEYKDINNFVYKNEKSYVQLILVDNTTVDITRFENFSRRKIESVSI